MNTHYETTSIKEGDINNIPCFPFSYKATIKSPIDIVYIPQDVIELNGHPLEGFEVTMGIPRKRVISYDLTTPYHIDGTPFQPQI